MISFVRRKIVAFPYRGFITSSVYKLLILRISQGIFHDLKRKTPAETPA